jgi:hypothetical protein
VVKVLGVVLTQLPLVLPTLAMVVKEAVVTQVFLDQATLVVLVVQALLCFDTLLPQLLLLELGLLVQQQPLVQIK